MSFGRLQACSRRFVGSQCLKQHRVALSPSLYAPCSKKSYFTESGEWIEAGEIWPLSGQGNSNTSKKQDPLRRNCIVTGGTSGIGYEIVKQLVQNGAKSVRLISRDVERAKKAVEAIRRDTGAWDAPLGIVVGDLFDIRILTGIWANYNASIREDQGQVIDTLINCAALPQSALLQSMNAGEIAGILRVNLQSPIELSRAFLRTYQSLGTHQRFASNPTPSMPSFCVINVSSLLAERSHGPGTSVYSASKAGLTAFTRSLAVEGAHIWARNQQKIPPFRANVVVPGYIDTRMTADFSSTHKNNLMSDIPLGRFGTPEEVADAVMFLLRNEYANNCVLNLDGGLSAL